jgi:flagellar motility protein MotE (MotC chaperone)
MRQLLREFRLVPVVLVAIGCLFVLKVVGLVSDGGYTLGGWHAAPNNFASPATLRVDSPAISLAQATPDSSKRSWAGEMFNFPGGSGGGNEARSTDITGAVGEGKSSGDVTGAAKDAPAKDAPAKDAPAKDGKESPAKDAAGKDVPQTIPAKAGTPVPLDGPRTLSAAERALLERLQERRNELDARARELDTRENLVKLAEKRLETRVAELKDLEGRLNVAAQKRDEAEASRFKNLVTMYENMKAKDAAKIFDRLDLKILVDVTNQINPRRMADILAQMTPEAAERLTVELASRASQGDKPAPNPADLPKIEGRPGG